MKSKFWITAGLLMVAPLSMASGFSYQNFELGYAHVTVDDDGYSESGNSFGVGLSHDLGEHIYLGGSIQGIDIAGINSTSYSLSLGGHTALGASTDVYAELGAMQINADYEGYSFDESGSVFVLGLRQQVAESVELAAGVVHTSGFGSDDNSYFGEVFYTVKPGLQLGLNIQGDESALNI